MFTKTRNQLIVFFILVFLLTWAVWIPGFMFPNFPKILLMIGLFAPAISGLIVAGLSNGRKGVSEVLGRYKYFRFKLRWYLIPTFLLTIVYGFSILINIGLFKHSTQNIFIGDPIYIIAGEFIWLMIINSGEEIGWRGFALPLLLKDSKSSFKASLLLGLIWGVWHLPMYLVPEQSSGFPYPLFLILTIGLSFIYTALFIKSKGSLLPAVLLHAGTDIGPRIYQQASYTYSIWLTIDILIIIIGIYFYIKTKDTKVYN